MSEQLSQKLENHTTFFELSPKSEFSPRNVLDVFLFETFIGELYQKAENRWQPVKDSSQLWINLELIPPSENHPNFPELNDAYPVDHLIHCHEMMIRVMNGHDDQVLIKDNNLVLEIVAITHDMAEGLVGDKISGTKTKEDRHLELNSYVRVLHYLSKKFPDQKNLLITVFKVFLADEKLDFISNLQLSESISCYFGDITSDRSSEIYTNLHKLYQLSHLLTFWNAILSIKDIIGNIDLIKNFLSKTERYEELVGNSKTNTFIVNYLHQNEVKITNLRRIVSLHTDQSDN
jgi:hypothetical protein